MTVAPARIAASNTWTRKSGSVRVASSAENSTSSQRLFARADGLGRDLEDLGPRLLQLVDHMDVGRGDEGMDPGTSRPAQGVPGDVDVLGKGAGQGGHDAVLHLGRNGLDGLVVPLRGDGEAGLDDVHAQGLEPDGDLELFRQRHAAARRLFPVAERRIEDLDFLGHDRFSLWSRERSATPGGSSSSSFSSRGPRTRGDAPFP